MILFAQDWQKYPDAIVDYSTKNVSFRKYASLLKSMGFVNHAFPLALHDRRLVGIDPFNYEWLGQNPQYVAYILVECRVNPWYFFREIVRVPAGSGDDASYLEANRGNMALFWYFFNHVTIYLIQIRQTGKSLNSDILDCYLLNIRCSDTTINLLTKDDGLRSVNIQRIKDIFTELPFYINQRTKKDLDNTEVINVSALKNWYRTALPQKSEKLALNVGRGFTAAIFKNDEGPFCANARISIPAALAAGTNARNRARKNNEPYGTVFTTTAGKKDDKDGAFFYQDIMSASMHTEAFMDCVNAEDLEETIRNSSRSNINTFKRKVGVEAVKRGQFAVNVTLNHLQLGKDDKWLLQAIEDSKASGEDADRDFFNIWTSGGLRSPFTAKQADMLRSSEREPNFLHRAEKQKYLMRWYIPMDKVDQVMRNNKIVVSVDTSDASGGDDIGISMYLDKTGQTIASCNINITNLSVFFDWFAHEIVIKYPTAVSIIERRSTGAALIDHLLMILPTYGIDPFKVLFNRVVNDKEQYPREWEEIQQPMNRRDPEIYTRLKRHFGFATSGSGTTSRSDLYSATLNSMLEIVGRDIYDKVTIDQLLGLIIKNGRVDHMPGSHDDMVIGLLMAHWLMTQGKNLQFYGFNILELFSLVKRTEVLTDRESYEARETARYKSMIQTLLEEIPNISDPYIVERKENAIQALRHKIPPDEDNLISVDELILKAKELRKERLGKNSMAAANYYDPNNRYMGLRSIGWDASPITSSSLTGSNW